MIVLFHAFRGVLIDLLFIDSEIKSRNITKKYKAVSPAMVLMISHLANMTRVGMHTDKITGMANLCNRKTHSCRVLFAWCIFVYTVVVRIAEGFLMMLYASPKTQATKKGAEAPFANLVSPSSWPVSS